MSINKILKTSIYDEHLKLGGRMIPFADYYMPANYKSGIINEYKSVRSDVGLFDVSHMGQIEISGQQSSLFLQYVTTNNIEKMKTGSAQYNLICNHNGGIIDDVIIYKLSDNNFIIIVNASNIAKDYKWLIKNKNQDIQIRNLSDNFSLIALQGPNSRKVISDLYNIELENKFYTFINKKIFDKEVLISRTGYTGELGYEILSDHETILKIWKNLIDKDVTPCGLAVRDTLRIEMKYCLYGNDINDEINPIEAGLKWVVDLSKEKFIGKNAIEKIYIEKPAKQLVCFEMQERGIPSKSYDIYSNDEKIGFVTSGTFSTNLNKGIGLGYVESIKIKDDICDIKIRNKFIKANIIKPPFITNYSLHD